MKVQRLQACQDLSRSSERPLKAFSNRNHAQRVDSAQAIRQSGLTAQITHILLALLVLTLLAGCTSRSPSPNEFSATLYDQHRLRVVPVKLYFPDRATLCTATSTCPTALLGPGYGVDHTHYSFIAKALNDLGYLVVAIQNQLPNDPDMPRGKNITALRRPFWQQGADNARFVRSELISRYPQFDWKHVVLVGHSHGGDSFAWLLRERPSWVSTLITLDNRRVALPRTRSIRVLSIRAGDFPADPGVLPTVRERDASPIRIVKLADARHNAMNDNADTALKRNITSLVQSFLRTADGSTTASPTAY